MKKKFANFGKSAKNFFLPEKNPTSSFKIGGILGKKIKFPIGSRFSDFNENLQKWSLERKNLPYFGKSAKNFFLLEKNPTLSWKIGGIFGQKMFRNFYENLQKYSLDRKNLPYFGKSAKNFLLEKNPTSSFKIGGIFRKKMFLKSFETSLIISL